MCARLLKCDWPTQGTPSPPIWVKPIVSRSIQVAMKWQPMPAIAREPSGTLVLVLCGQPLQNQGWRSAPPVAPVLSARSLASITAMRASMRAAMSAGRPSLRSRLAMAWAISVGFRSALARSSQLPLGLAWLHSPPELSPSTSSNLPSTLGRTSGRQL